MKRILSLALALLMCVALIVPVAAASTEAQSAANSLNQLGLFNGVGSNADGSPNYDLDRAPTRAEAVTLLVRLLGKEADAKVGQWSNGFTDVPDWAKPYVGYAYQNGLTTGNSASYFGSEEMVSATQYLTFVLRALGYSSGTDFTWDKAYEKTDELGLTKGEYSAGSAFLRGDAVLVSYKALDMKVKGGEQTLLAVIEENLKNAPPVPKTPAELMAEAVQKIKTADSVSYRATGEITLTTSLYGQSQTVSMYVVEEIDLFAGLKKFRKLAAVESDVTDPLRIETYLIPEGDAYMAYFNEEGTWDTVPASKSEAVNMSQGLANVITMYIDSFTDLSKAGETTLAGERVVKYSAVLPNAVLQEDIDAEGFNVMFIGAVLEDEDNAAEIAAAMGDLLVTVYLNEAGYLLRFEVDLKEAVNSMNSARLASMGISPQEGTITCSKALLVYDYSNYNSVPDFGAPAMN